MSQEQNDGIDNEIELLRNKLLALEIKKKHNDEINKKYNVQLNLDIIQHGIDERTKKVNADRYSKSCISGKFIDRDMIPQLQAIPCISKLLLKQSLGNT